jgi:hypothetical protein
MNKCFSKIFEAMAAYEEANGHMPYDPRGSDAALYLLKPFVQDPTIFQSPARGPDLKELASPKWDDAEKVVQWCDFEYLNPGPGFKFDDMYPDIIFLSEKTYVRLGSGRYVFTFTIPIPLFIRADWVYGRSPLLGKRYATILEINTDSPGSPLQRLKVIYKALCAYEEANGCLPYDPRGSKASFYLLRPFIEDVKIFRVLRLHLAEDDPVPSWNCSEKTLEHCDFEYFNPGPNVKRSDFPQDTIILAEGGHHFGGGQWLLDVSGIEHWLPYGWIGETTPIKVALGKRWAEGVNLNSPENWPVFRKPSSP